MNPQQKLGAPRTTVTAGSAQVVRRGDELTITGTPAAVGQELDALKAAGRLDWFESPVRTRVPGQVCISVGLVPQRRLSPRTVGALAAGGAVGVAGIGWAVVELVAVVVEHAAVIIGGLLVAVVVLVLVGRAAGGGTFSGTFQGRMD